MGIEYILEDARRHESRGQLLAAAQAYMECHSDCPNGRYLDKAAALLKANDRQSMRGLFPLMEFALRFDRIQDVLEAVQGRILGLADEVGPVACLLQEHGHSREAVEILERHAKYADECMERAWMEYREALAKKLPEERIRLSQKIPAFYAEHAEGLRAYILKILERHGPREQYDAMMLSRGHYEAVAAEYIMLAKAEKAAEILEQAAQAEHIAGRIERSRALYEKAHKCHMAIQGKDISSLQWEAREWS